MSAEGLEQEAVAAQEIDSVSEGTRLILARHKRQFYGAWAVALVLMAAAFVFMIYKGGAFAANVWIFIFVPLAIPLYFYSRFQREARGMMAAQIARSFGYSYASDAPIESIDGVIFSHGTGRNISDVLSGSYRGMPVRIFSYQFTVSHGKSSTTYTNTVCELALDVALPHIVLLPHDILATATQTDVGFFSELDSMERASLEGDFNEYFDIYVDHGAQLELREVLEPDIMRDLIDRFSGCDIEVRGAKLYLLKHGQLSTRGEYAAFHGLADALVDKLLPGLRAAALQQASTANDAGAA